MATIEQLKDVYKFVGDDVEEYLQKNKDLIDILMEGVEPIQKMFYKIELSLIKSKKDKGLFLSINGYHKFGDKETKYEENEWDEWYEKYANTIKGRLSYLILEAFI